MSNRNQMKTTYYGLNFYWIFVNPVVSRLLSHCKQVTGHAFGSCMRKPSFILPVLVDISQELVKLVQWISHSTYNPTTTEFWVDNTFPCLTEFTSVLAISFYWIISWLTHKSHAKYRIGFYWSHHHKTIGKIRRQSYCNTIIFDH